MPIVIVIDTPIIIISPNKRFADIMFLRPSPPPAVEGTADGEQNYFRDPKWPPALIVWRTVANDSYSITWYGEKWNWKWPLVAILVTYTCIVSYFVYYISYFQDFVNTLGGHLLIRIVFQWPFWIKILKSVISEGVKIMNEIFTIYWGIRPV